MTDKSDKIVDPKNEYWVGNIYNFRSLETLNVTKGSIKPNHIFRGGFFFNRGLDDIKSLHTEKKIQTFLDLRSSDEVPSGYRELVEGEGIAYYNSPLIPFWRSVFYLIFRVPFWTFISAFMSALSALLHFRIGLFIESMKSTSTSFPLGWFYPIIYHYGKKELNGLFSFIAEHCDNPFIFYCSFGKDRTGLIGCMIGMLLGADIEECVKEYKLSDRSLKDHMVVAKDHFKLFGGDEKGYELAKTDDKLLREFDRFIKTKYGTIENYFTKFVGLSELQITQIRKNCLVGI
ncbi:hypothetical protein EIN_184520 [Entamoeba invadens IP1]|nr:hypothetical protein EIN_184520 [Entamoeba invadens IP1]ELP94095.1 hypothetical protein EIN_184520 [Entamoeba invadens IP1]|eukprot:XP_004260866.1 hypothetical protein EIN_184520 [Entamoeba invadens IP1]